MPSKDPSIVRRRSRGSFRCNEQNPLPHVSPGNGEPRTRYTGIATARLGEIVPISDGSELPCHENGFLLTNHLLWLLPEASRNVFERRIHRNSDCTRMGERARCLPGDQTGLASLGSLSVEAARRPWPILIEPTSPRGGKTKWRATVPHVRARLHTVSCASRSVHFPPAVYIEGGAGDVFRPWSTLAPSLVP